MYRKDSFGSKLPEIGVPPYAVNPIFGLFCCLTWCHALSLRLCVSIFGWHALSLRRVWAVRVDLASVALRQYPTEKVGLQRSITWARSHSRSCPALQTWNPHGESVLASPRPSKTQSVPPSGCAPSGCAPSGCAPSGCAFGLLQRSSLADSGRPPSPIG